MCWQCGDNFYFVLMSTELAHNTTIIGTGFVLSINALALLCFGFEGLFWEVQIQSIYHPVKINCIPFCKVTSCWSALCDSVGTGVSSQKGQSTYRRWTVEQVTFCVFHLFQVVSVPSAVLRTFGGISHHRFWGFPHCSWQHMVLQDWSCRKLPAPTCREPEFLLPRCS